jgi:hypothetical protein
VADLILNPEAQVAHFFLLICRPTTLLAAALVVAVVLAGTAAVVAVVLADMTVLVATGLDLDPVILVLDLTPLVSAVVVAVAQNLQQDSAMAVAAMAELANLMLQAAVVVELTFLVQIFLRKMDKMVMDYHLQGQRAVMGDSLEAVAVAHLTAEMGFRLPGETVP